MRLSTTGNECLNDARELSVSYCGAEGVAAVTLAQLGENVSFASKLTDSQLGDNALMTLARYGVNTSCVIRSPERMGLFFTERGLSIRPTVVTYDRSGTAMAKARHTDFNWDKMLNGVEVFYFSGVVPAISDEMYLACLEGLRECKGRAVRTVMDLNYRNTMWSSREDARRKISALLPYVDQLVASEDDVLSFEGSHVDENSIFDFCLSWAKGMFADYSLHDICTIVRHVDRYGMASIRGALLTRKGTFLSLSQQVTLADISSCGSVFAASATHGMYCGWDEQSIVDFATMASAYKATIYGDYSSASEADIASLLSSGFKPHIRQ